MAHAAGTCPPAGLGVSRIVEIDTSSGPLFGDITKSVKEHSFLKPKEVVLTFDDGPLPGITKSILDTLDRFCTKATFFSVGRMAVLHPAMLKDVLARGHTLGSHTWSHQSLPRLSLPKAKEEIERGFAAVAMAAGQPVAPFFRFPGLGDSPALLAYLQERGIAAFTVDIVSNDSFIGDPARLASLTLSRIEARQGGIVLFHDIKSVTAKALPVILTELVAKGYKVVHLRAKEPVKPVADYDSELIPVLAQAEQALNGKPTRVSLRSAAEPARKIETTPVTELAPPPRHRPVATASEPKPQAPATATAPVRASEAAVTAEGWSPRVKRPQKRPAAPPPSSH